MENPRSFCAKIACKFFKTLIEAIVQVYDYENVGYDIIGQGMVKAF